MGSIVSHPLHVLPTLHVFNNTWEHTSHTSYKYCKCHVSFMTNVVCEIPMLLQAL